MLTAKQIEGAVFAAGLRLIMPLLIGIPIGLLIGILIGKLIIDPLRAYDNTDNVLLKERSGLKIYVDNLTGCEYLSVSAGGLTPQLDNNQQQICHKGD